MADNLFMSGSSLTPASPDQLIQPPTVPTASPDQVLNTGPAAVAGQAQQAGSGLQAGHRRIPVNRRYFGHAPDIRKLIYDNVVSSASLMKPTSNARYQLALSDFEYTDPEEVSLKKQKEAILANKTLYRRLKGTWRLTDTKTGDLIDEKRMTIAQVPYMTDRGTFIINGTEYTLSHQMRLRPGIFTRIKANNEIEAHVNVMPGQGVSHRYFFEPETSVFKINVGQSKVPLLPVLKAMGIPDSRVREAWGSDIFAINQQHDSPHVIDKLYQRMVRKADMTASRETKAQALSNELQKMELDPEVTKRTLGKPYSRLSADAILDTTKKLLAVNKREIDADDRDHLAFQHLMGPEDLIAERIGKDRSTLAKLLWHATNKSNLEHIQPGAFTNAIMAAFKTSGLGQAAEEVNAAELVDHQGRITRLGEGGIGSAQAVPEDSRNVHPSQMAFVDPVKTPECWPSHCSVMTYDGWKLWPSVTADDKLACWVNGRLEFHKPIHLFYSDYDDEIYAGSNSYIRYEVTPNHRMWVQPYHSPKAAWRFELATEMHDCYMRFAIGGHDPYEGDKNLTHYDLPGWNVYPDIQIAMDDWCALMGWYLSNGSVNLSSVIISQYESTNKAKCKLIEDLLKRLPFEWFKRLDNKGYYINDRRLTEHVKLLGSRYDKHIPEDLFEASVSARQNLYDTLLLGSGQADRKGGSYELRTSSEKLAEDFQRLAFSLGQSSIISTKSKKRSKKDGSKNLDMYIVRLHKEATCTIEDNKRAKCVNQFDRYSTYHYTGKVYCAEVPGGLLYCKTGDKGGFWSGNSFKAGVDLRTSFGVQKGSDGRMYAPFDDPRRPGRKVYKSPQELADLTVSFPGELHSGRQYVHAMVKGRLSYVPRHKVDLELPSMENAFSPLSNMVPMKSAVKGQRVSMGARMLSQALPLMNAQAPLVQSAIPGTYDPVSGEPISFEQLYGRHMGIVYVKDDGGVVLESNDEHIKVKLDNGKVKTYELYNHHPYNRKTYLHNTNFMKAGERFNRFDVLAKSNYTDDTGVAALGLNARVAYLPFQGKNYEDAIVISESMAKRLTSEHMYQHVGDFDGVHKGKNAFISLFPGAYDRKTLETMDEHGVVKPGTIIRYGDPLVLMAKEKERAHNQVHRGKALFNNDTITWKHHSEGLVTDVVHNKNHALVAVKAYMPMQVGDKLSGRYGDKGVISDIVSDDHMPKDSEGKPFEILLSPMGLISRINAAQAVEAALGKIADKTGKPYKIEDFKHPNLVQFALDELKKHNMEDLDTVTDPLTDRKIPGVLTGNRFFMKLHHTSECFDKMTEVLTDRGWVFWPDVTSEDKLASVENNRLIFEKPLGTMIYRHAGPLYCFANYHVDYAVTERHWLYANRFLIQERYVEPSARSFKLETAADLHGGRFRIAQFGYEQNVVSNDPTIQIDDLSLPWSDYAELIGWWVRNGSVKLTERLSLIYLNQVKSKNKNAFAKLLDFATRLNLPWHIHKSDDESEELGVCISNRALATHLKTFGTRPNNKRLPRSLLKQPASVLRYMLETITIIEDNEWGLPYKKHDGWKYYTPSKGLADDLQELCIRAGIGATVYHRPELRLKFLKHKPSSQRYYKLVGQEMWECDIELKRMSGVVNGVRDPELFNIRPYDDYVYCAEMRTGLLYVRRNGKPMLSGNSKGQGRGAGGGYTSEGTPSKGGETGSKRVSLMDTNALLAHGATDVLRDAHVVRGQKNEDFWLQFMSGQTPPEPKVPFIYEKFLNELKGSGINVIRDGHKLHVMALTDKDIQQMTEGRELQNPETVDWKGGLKPKKGGLFDPGLTGGHAGNKWSKISLVEPMPNPVMEEPIRRVLGLTEANFLEVLTGNKELNGKKGPEAITTALKGINLDKEISRTQAEINSGRKSLRDAAVRRLQYLESAKKLNIHPSEWVVNSVPVLPPTFRPVNLMAGKRGQLVSDPNYLYKEVWDSNQSLLKLKDKIDDVSQERLNLYNAFKAVTGLGDPIHPKNVDRKVKGILRHIFGTNPKFGTIQFKLLGASVNLVGRGVIIPNPDIDMDSIGLPEHRAWEVYQPFIVRGLTRRGMPKLAALQAVKDKTKAARDTLMDAMKERPVIVNRYPVLHRYGLMAFWPKLIKGETIQVSPIITKGFAADFDGDTMQYHVPASEDARVDAVEKMLPSRNLFSGSSFKVHYLPNQEYIQGLHAASAAKEGDKSKRVFATKKDALTAYRRGEINLGTPIEVLE